MCAHERHTHVRGLLFSHEYGHSIRKNFHRNICDRNHTHFWPSEVQFQLLGNMSGLNVYVCLLFTHIIRVFQNTFVYKGGVQIHFVLK